jgi:hypothetical protein
MAEQRVSGRTAHGEQAQISTDSVTRNIALPGREMQLPDAAYPDGPTNVSSNGCTSARDDFAGEESSFAHRGGKCQTAQLN